MMMRRDRDTPPFRVVDKQMGPAGPQSGQEGRKSSQAVAVALAEEDDFEELFGITPGGLAGAVEEGNLALKQLNRLERIIAGDVGCQEVQLVAGGGEWSALDPEVLRLARLLAGGKYLEVLESSGAASWLLREESRQEADDGKEAGHIADVIGARVVAYVCGDEGNADGGDAHLWRAVTALWVGVASLNLHLQANYTGPALEMTPSLTRFTNLIQTLTGPHWGLDADGEAPYSKSVLPEMLSLARAVLHPLALPGVCPWSTPLELSPEDGQPRLATQANPCPSAFRPTVVLLETCKLWAGRAVVTHHRLLSGRHSSPGLWAEAQALFLPLVKTLPEPEKGTSDPWATRVWLEWGLAQHHLEEPSKGKHAFNNAVTASGLQLTLTAAMGKRTKFQQHDLAQMVLLAKPVRPSEAPGGSDDKPVGGNGQMQEEEPTLAGSAASSKPLPSAVEHPSDSVRLETVAYSDPKVVQEEAGGANATLRPLEQSVILALCLDISNNNPKDGLTSEEMKPYVERVLKTPANWMVYSTGLLERSWLDFESPYGRERAVLQLQALVDQHGTRLTLTQASSDVIADSAPAQERLQYVHCIAYPPQWELKRSLADRYAKLGVYGSAAEMYLEVEQWDEVVQCYRVLERVAKAEALVRERLQVEETPAMWVALGDLTQDAKCYEKAWELSRRRNARAKRSLGRMAFRNKELEEALGHFKEAVAIMPLVPDTWFLMGVIHMGLERWEEAAWAFTRVVQQEPDDGRAWGNLGAVHTKAGNFEKALAAFKEGVRYQRDSAHMWENYLICATKLEQYSDVITAFQRLLDLRQNQSGNKWEVDVEILDFLVHRTVADPSQTEAHNREGDDDAPLRASLQKRVAELLGRASSVVSTDGRLWTVYATFNERRGRWDQALDCRIKACRAYVNKSQWTKEASMVKTAVEALEALGKAYLREPTSSGLQQCLWFLRSPMQKLSVEPWGGSPEQDRVKKVYASIEEGLAQLKEQQQQN